jgi:hypothetical protein
VPTIRNCTVTGNRCTFGGGAVYIFTAGASFTDCRFDSNVGAVRRRVRHEQCDRRLRGACSSATSPRARAPARATETPRPPTRTAFPRGNQATGSNGGGAVWIGVNSAVTARNCTFVGSNT